MNIEIIPTQASRIGEVDFSNLPFGKVMSDHMAIAEYKDGEWTNPRIVPFAPLSFSPSISALHYGQAVFEGMKAHKNDNGEVLAFRIKDHGSRLNKSLSRLAMPEISQELFSSLLKALLKLDKEWVPAGADSFLYLRPFVFATDESIGVRPSSTYTFIIFGSPSGAYYSKSLRLKVEEKYSRAAPGGVGFAKAAGNYAASMRPTAEAVAEGFDQLLWTDSSTHSFVEESGTMNIFFVLRSDSGNLDGNGMAGSSMAGDTLITPILGETILAGINRDSLIQIAKKMGMKVEERKISVDEVCGAIESGELIEAFGVGTAVTVAPVASITYKGKEYALPVSDAVTPSDTQRSATQTSYAVKFKKMITDIRGGKATDEFGWVEKV